MRQRLRLDQLAQILAASRVSQNHWAIRLGLSRGHWSDLVNGRHPYPSRRTRERMLEVFRVASDDLFEPEPSDDQEEIAFRVAIATRYELTAELGQGGMGTVFLANDRALGRLVALKMVAAEAAAGIGADQLLQEIAMVSRLQHPNILPLHDAGERAGTPYYVMPYIRDGSLAALLRERARLPLLEALALVRGIAAGLAHAHEHRILHCDIKPENILIQNGHPFVMDFGIARKLHSETAEWSPVRKELDFSAGTPAYVSPEQAAGQPDIDQRSDVYSFACVVYEMLAGRPPFRGSSTQEIVLRRFAGPPPPLRAAASDVPAEVAAVIARAMALNPSQRPGSVLSFEEELRTAAGSASAWRTRLSVGATRARRWLQDVSSGPRRSRPRPPRLREWLGTLRRDVVYAYRQRRRAPGLTVMAILTLGLGIGLTTAVFAAVNGLLLRQLPYEQPDRLVALQSVDSLGQPVSRVSSSNWNDWREESRSLSAIAIYQPMRVSVVADGQALRADAQNVSAEFFDVIRPRLTMGRAFTAADVDDKANLAVVSEAFWRRHLGASRTADLDIEVNGFSYDMLGVIRGDQVIPEGTDIWLLFRYRPFPGDRRNNINWFAVGRLAPSSTTEQARTELSTIARRIQQTHPGTLYSHGVDVIPLQDQLVGDTSDLLGLLAGAVGLVLLIACANLTSANLAQGTTREREMAIRTALGAVRRRLVRQVLVEHLLLALVGGAVGALLAWALTQSAALLAASHLPLGSTVVVDVRVLLFTLGVATIAGLLTGLVPALLASRATPSSAIEGGTRGSVGGGRGLPGRVLVGAEIAMALMLVTGAGLLVQSLRSVLARPLGFETRGVVTAEITLGGPRYSNDSAAVLAYWENLLQRLGSVPGIRSAGVANWVPLVRGGTGLIEIADRDIPDATAGYQMVSDRYFEALGIPLRAGRGFSGIDQPGSERVALINQRMADRYWPGESPLGRRVRATSMEPGFNGNSPWLTVVGVVGDVRQFGYETDVAPAMYVLYRQLPSWRIGTLTAVVRGGGGSDVPLMEAVRQQVSALDVGIPADLAFLDAHAARVTASRRFAMLAVAAFGVLALVLASLGVYGVLSFAVARRRREMAVRAALGADRAMLLRLVLGSGARVVVAGIGAGVLGAFFLTSLLRSMLFEVSPRDPAVLSGAAVVIAAIGMLAALIPARRATRIEPMETLRND
ncbi:MAG: ADOP family duplicated permease [Gemmatimonadaceae bacterium]